MNYYSHKILKPFTVSPLILRLDKELVEKEAADAAMAREKAVLD